MFDKDDDDGDAESAGGGFYEVLTRLLIIVRLFIVGWNEKSETFELFKKKVQISNENFMFIYLQGSAGNEPSFFRQHCDFLFRLNIPAF